MNDIDSVLLGHIEKRRLTVNVFIIKGKSTIQEQIQALLFPFPTNVKEDSLLIIVLEMRICAVFQKQFHYFV